MRTPVLNFNTTCVAMARGYLRMRAKLQLVDFNEFLSNETEHSETTLVFIPSSSIIRFPSHSPKTQGVGIKVSCNL